MTIIDTTITNGLFSASVVPKYTVGGKRLGGVVILEHFPKFPEGVHIIPEQHTSKPDLQLSPNVLQGKSTHLPSLHL
jgi:hypothetical protein